VGVAMELIFFSLGLAHKRRMDAIEKIEAQEALKLAEEREHVKNLNALTEVQEQERSRFAKDLHDGLGGMLSGVKLSLSNMKGNMVLSGDHVQTFERSLDMLDNSIIELRRVAHNLMPEALVKFGLTAALKDFCDFVNGSKVVNVIFQQMGNDKRLDMSVEVVLYRVVNELVNNSLRHSSASEIIIQLNYDDHSLTITLEDNGVGFDQSILEKTKGSGWPNIKSRIDYLKGSLDIETSRGNGTAVNITIPV
jgi:two-component system NarL family sensor kinase